MLHGLVVTWRRQRLNPDNHTAYYNDIESISVSFMMSPTERRMMDGGLFLNAGPTYDYYDLI